MSDEFHKYVVIAAPGEPNGQGGIIRQMAYLKGAWPPESDWKLNWLTSWNHKGCKPCVFLRSIVKLIWLRQRNRADILHLNLASQGSFYRKYILARVARLMRIPLVVHLHGGGFQTFYDTAPAILQRRIEWLFYEAHHCVVLGHGWQHFLELRFRMPYEKITICHNAVPDVAPAPKTHEVPHLLFMGHVLARKGMDDLVQSLANLTDLPWRATIAGSGDVAYYRDQVAKHGLQARVRFTGWIDGKALESLYADSDVLLLPSYVENQPLCVLEAMARGVAVIASNVGTMSELVEHGKTGLLIDAGDVEALQAAIKILVEDAPARQRLAQSARADYEKRFTLGRAVDQWRAIYQEVLSF